MQYGGSGRASNTPSNLVYSGLIDDAETVTLIFETGGQYLLTCGEFNASTGAYRGHRASIIKVPEEQFYGSQAVQRVNLGTSTNYGVSIVENADSTVSLSRSAATYAVRYAVYRLF